MTNHNFCVQGCEIKLQSAWKSKYFAKFSVKRMSEIIHIIISKQF